MKQRIILRADASKSIGFGHFIRSLALAGYLKDDFDCCFASFNEDEKALSRYQLTEIFRVSTPFVVRGTNLDEYNEDFISQIHPSDIVVLDNYYFQTEFQRKIKEKGCKLVCIDDVHDRHMVCDILFTPCPLRRDIFSLEQYTKFYGGIEWAFLREPFLTPVPNRNISSDIKRVVMGLGGSDAFNLTDKMIAITHNLLPYVQIDVICGDYVYTSEESKKIAHIHRKLSAAEIVPLFDNADLGIFPASTICIEAFSRKLPVIAGFYADNQREFYDYGVKENFFGPLGNLLEDSLVISNRLKDIILNNRPVPVVKDFKTYKNRIIELFSDLKVK